MEFLRLSDEAEKKRNFEFLPKGNALKRKLQEKQDEAKQTWRGFAGTPREKKKIM